MADKKFNPELREELTQEFGLDCLKNQKGEIAAINQQFFAEFFARTYQPIYEITEETFYLCDSGDGLWTPRSIEQLYAKISLMLKRYSEVFAVEYVAGKRDVQTIRNIVTFLKASCARKDAFLRTGAPMIHCGNGIIQFKKLPDGRYRPELMPFSPDFMSRNRTEIEYAPEAKCPEFMTKLLSPAMSEDDIYHLQLYLAQCLLGKNKSHTFLLMTGTAGAGKSTVVNIIEKLINRVNCTELRLEHMNGRFETQRLLGKTLLTAKDVKSNFLNSPGAYKLKALTGKDTLTIEHKGSNAACDVVCEFNAIITANATLRVALDGDADAWRRRIIWITYDNAPPKDKIPDFDDYLLEKEGSGILAWAVEGAVMLLENGLKITKSDEQAAKVEKLLRQSDALDEFSKNCLCEEAGATVTTTELVGNFRNFCLNHGWTPLPERQVEKRLPEYIYQRYGLSKRTDVKRVGKNNRGYYGLKLV